jgi:hypothetical protein
MRKNSGSGFAKHKTRKGKITKAESRIQAVGRIPLPCRWWMLWKSSPSHTVSSVVSELPRGASSELMWSRAIFEKNVKAWMIKSRDSNIVDSAIFSR